MTIEELKDKIQIISDAQQSGNQYNPIDDLNHVLEILINYIGDTELSDIIEELDHAE